MVWKVAKRLYCGLKLKQLISALEIRRAALDDHDRARGCQEASRVQPSRVGGVLRRRDGRKREGQLRLVLGQFIGPVVHNGAVSFDRPFFGKRDVGEVVLLRWPRNPIGGGRPQWSDWREALAGTTRPRRTVLE